MTRAPPSGTIPPHAGSVHQPERPARRAQPGLRLPELSGCPGRGDRAGDRRRRRPGAHAHRRRQVALLSDPGPDPTRHRAGGLAPDRPDAGPGGCPAPARGEGGLPELIPAAPGAVGGGDRAPRGRARPALRGPGAPPDRALPGAARAHARRPIRHRRGPLRLPVGARLPTRVLPARRAARPLAGGAPDRAHGHRRHPHPPRDRRASGARGRGQVRLQLRPAEHPLSHRREVGAASPAARAPARAPAGRIGDRLLSLPPQGGRDRRLPARSGFRCACLSRGDGRRAAPYPPGEIPQRRGGDRGGDHRLRDGYRQARRALRGPSRPAQEPGGLLPGDRAGRARRLARRGLDGLRDAGRGDDAPHHRVLRGRGALQAGGAAQAQRPARILRDHRMSAPGDAGLFRRDPDRRPAATATPV